MRIVVLGAAAVTAALLLGGCSARNADHPSAATPSTTASTDISVLQKTTGLVRLTWTAANKEQAGMPVVNIVNDDCVTPKGVTVQETSAAVRITAWGSKSKEPCTAIGYALSGAVPLREPLGTRTLEHG